MIVKWLFKISPEFTRTSSSWWYYPFLKQSSKIPLIWVTLIQIKDDSNQTAQLTFLLPILFFKKRWSFCIANEAINKRKGSKLWNWGKVFASHILNKEYPKYTRNSYNSRKKTSSSISKWAADLIRHFPKEGQQIHKLMLNISNHQGKCKLKTTMRYHLRAIRTTIIKKITNTKHWRGCKDRGTPIHCWECKLEQSLWKTVCRFLQKLNMELPYDPAIPLLGIYLKKMKTLTWKK